MSTTKLYVKKCTSKKITYEKLLYDSQAIICSLNFISFYKYDKSSR